MFRETRMEEAGPPDGPDVHAERVWSEDDLLTSQEVRMAKARPLVERMRTSLFDTPFKDGEKEAMDTAINDIIFSLRKDLGQLRRFCKEQIAKARKVEYTKESGLQVQSESGGMTEITEGQLFSELIWGSVYNLGDSVPAGIVGRYNFAIEKSLKEELEGQIEALNKAWKHFKNNDGAKDAYAAFIETGEEKKEKGDIAELMARSLLTRLSIDHDLPFEVVSVSVKFDVEYTIDFILRFHKHDRGVKVNAVDNTQIGIQFTISTTHQVLKHKEAQVGKANRKVRDNAELNIKDVVLVDVPVLSALTAKKNWDQAKKTGKPVSGGPDQYLDQKTQGALFSGILKNLPNGVLGGTKEESSAKINEMWRQANVA